MERARVECLRIRDGARLFLLCSPKNGDDFAVKFTEIIIAKNFTGSTGRPSLTWCDLAGTADDDEVTEEAAHSSASAEDLLSTAVDRENCSDVPNGHRGNYFKLWRIF